MRLLAFALIATLAYVALTQSDLVQPFAAGPVGSDSAIEQAYRNRTSNLQVEGRGEVVRILPDDRDGSRHQRFILKVSSVRTVLIAHNIDLAPRIPDLSQGDIVEFCGEYDWNDRGGVVHWTHHDPQGRHVAGWLRHMGKTYQ
jgi:hypothetical protein